MRRGRVGVLIFARPAIAGQAKTRLAARLGAYGAARLHARLVRRTVRMAAASGAQLEFHVASDRRCAEFIHLLRRYGMRSHRQRGADLGERMRRGFDTALRRYSRVVLIGTDCPQLTVQHIRRAARALSGGAESAFAPAEDGGYALMALRRPGPRLFEGIQWGTSAVYRETLTKAASLGWATRDVGRVRDVDGASDLDWYRDGSWRFKSCIAPMNPKGRKRT